MKALSTEMTAFGLRFIAQEMGAVFVEYGVDGGSGHLVAIWDREDDETFSIYNFPSTAGSPVLAGTGHNQPPSELWEEVLSTLYPGWEDKMSYIGQTNATEEGEELPF